MNSEHDELQPSVGFSDVIAWLRSNWMPILVSASCCVLLGIAYILVASPRYKVETLLAPENTANTNQLLSQFGSQLGALGLGGVLNQGGHNRSEVSIAILESRQFLGDFIKRHSLLPALFESRWDEDEKDWADNDDAPPTINDGYQLFSEKVLLIERNEVSGFVTVSVEWSDAKVAHYWLVSLIRELNEDVRQRERDEATRSLEFLRDELARTEIMELREALHQLSRAELQKLTLANVREEFAFKTIDPPNIPDLDDQIWPRPVLILLGSVIFGLLFGIAIAVLLTAWRLSIRSS